MHIVIVGAGGHARVIIDSLVAAGEHKIVGLTDPDSTRWGTYVDGFPILGNDDLLPQLVAEGVEGVIIALGLNRLRARLFEHVQSLGFHVVSAIHPYSWISPSAQIGPGTAIMAHVVINAGARIGTNSIINTSATIDHDCSIGDHAHVAPGCHLSGGVSIGTGAIIGVGATIIPDRTIGDWASIGAGAAVIHDIPNAVVAVGVPARVKEKKAG